MASTLVTSLFSFEVGWESNKESFVEEGRPDAEAATAASRLDMAPGLIGGLCLFSVAATAADMATSGLSGFEVEDDDVGSRKETLISCSLPTHCTMAELFFDGSNMLRSSEVSSRECVSVQ